MEAEAAADAMSFDLKPYTERRDRVGGFRDSVERTRHDRALLRRKLFLRRLYAAFYSELAQALPGDVPGAVVEIGSGAGFLTDHVPGLITSDVLPGGMSDLCCDACRMPFRSSSLKGILMLDVFHHIPAPESFLEEAVRCLRPGGVVAMIEPWITPVSYAVLKLLHPERTDPRQAEWHFESTGPMSGANQAIPWMVFQRDRRKFEMRFPKLSVERIRLHTPLAYLASGGLTRWEPLPASGFGAVRALEGLIQPLWPVMAMFATILLSRRP